MPTFTAVVTAHSETVMDLLADLKRQTVAPDEVRLYYSGSVPLYGATILFPDIVAIECEDRFDWGHEKRRMGIAEATGDYVGFFNADDAYKPGYLASMLGAAEVMSADLVYTDWQERGNPKPIISEPRLGRITSGSFIVRTEFARQVGYKHDDYSADGRFIEDLVASGAFSVHVPAPDPLYHHR